MTAATSQPPAPATPAAPSGGARPRLVTVYGVGLALDADGQHTGEMALVVDPGGPAPLQLQGDPADFEKLAARLMRVANQARGNGGLQ